MNCCLAAKQCASWRFRITLPVVLSLIVKMLQCGNDTEAHKFFGQIGNVQRTAYRSCLALRSCTPICPRVGTDDAAGGANHGGNRDRIGQIGTKHQISGTIKQVAP